MRTAQYGLVVLLLLAKGPIVLAQSQQKPCLALFQKQNFLQAAQCYESQIPRRILTTVLTEAQRVSYGRLLRNAALAYQNAAQKKAKSTEQAAYWNERALKLVRRYLARKLYENTYRKQSAERLTRTLSKRINYGTLTIQGRSSDSFQLKGFSFSKVLQGTWSQKVRPGTYQLLRLTLPQRTFVLKVKPGQSLVFAVPVPVKPRRLPPPRRRVTPNLRRTPPPPHKPKLVQSSGTRRAGWIVLGTGGGIALLGGGLLGGASIAEFQKEQTYQQALRDQNTSLEVTQQILQHHETARALYPTSYAVLGVAGALLVTGALLVALSPSKPPTTSTPPPSTSRAHSLWRDTP
ncbi:MAG: hypothetical protein EP343_11490 [Deltaproteobacteria bacterium]|nr:MAG: hypothetical protein EP343_11490 [Deltaproteobacteria bacterium]